MKVVSRKEAQQAGLSCFYTGKPCKYGHYAPRHVIGRYCYECNNLKVSRWMKNNPKWNDLCRRKNAKRQTQSYAITKNAYLG